MRKEATLVARSFGGRAAAARRRSSRSSPAATTWGCATPRWTSSPAPGHAATAVLSEAFPRLDADGRKLAVETLGRGQDPAALGALELALADADDNVREGAIEAIAGLGSLARERVAEVLLASPRRRRPAWCGSPRSRG